VYHDSKQYDKSLSYLNQALPLYESLDEFVKIGNVYATMGDDYIAKKDYPMAIEQGLKANEMAVKTNDNGIHVSASLLLGTAYLHFAKDTSSKLSLQEKKTYLGKAIAELEKGVVWADGAKYLRAQAGFFEQLSEAYVLSGRKADAYESYKNYVRLRDSLASNDTRLKIAALETKRESDLKEKQIEINKVQAKQKSNQQIFFLSGIFLLSVIVFLVVRNNRKQKRTNARLAEEKEKSDKLARELEELNTVKDKLFSAISHDLRSPLGRVTNMLYMMQRGNMTEEKLKERTTEFLGAMQQTMQMLDNLLYWATSQMKGLTLSKTNIRISELVDENLELMQSEAAVKKIEMIDKIGATANALADANMTRLVLRNLISNAIKFTPENGSITITAEAWADKVRVEIKDTGVGMYPETIQALYANKQVNSKSGTRQEKGFGIGLQLCKDFIEQNGGTLEISSEPGKGSTFSFTLPAS
jgi:signal transduction histidine kinase